MFYRLEVVLLITNVIYISCNSGKYCKIKYKGMKNMDRNNY